MSADQYSPVEAALDAAKSIACRRSVGPKHLTEPAPDAAVLALAADAARTAPCHDDTFPVRFVVMVDRERFARLFEATVAPDASESAMEKARSKALKAPMQIAVVVRTDSDNARAQSERFATAGAALMNFLFVLEAAGFAAKTVSGRDFPEPGDLYDPERECVLAFIMCGTPDKETLALREQPRDREQSILSRF